MILSVFFHESPYYITPRWIVSPSAKEPLAPSVAPFGLLKAVQPAGLPGRFGYHPRPKMKKGQQQVLNPVSSPPLLSSAKDRGHGSIQNIDPPPWIFSLAKEFQELQFLQFL